MDDFISLQLAKLSIKLSPSGSHNDGVDDGEDKEATPEVTVIGSREEDNKTPVPQMPDEDVSMMDVGDMSLNVTETVGSLSPLAHNCKESAKSPKKLIEVFVPGSVPPIPTSGHSIPEGQMVSPSPMKATSEEGALVVPKEAEPSASTDILPELSESVLETLGGLEPVGHPEESNENEEPQKMSFEELGPDSVPPMSSTSFGFPASRGVDPTSPKKIMSKDTTAEEPSLPEKPNEPQIDASQAIAETTVSLKPSSPRTESDNSPQSAQKPLEEFGPDSVPPMATTGLGFPASRVENVTSPEKLDPEEDNSETATDTLLLPEFEGEEMIGDGELPDLVRVVNGGSGAGKDSTPDFEEEERKMLVEERKESKEVSTSI